MPSLTIRLSKEQYTELKRIADEQHLTITEFLLKNTIPHTLNNILSLDDIVQRALSLNKDKVFNIKSLFSCSEWDSFIKNSRMSSSRNFYKAVNNNLKDDIEFLGKDKTNLSLYKRK